MSRLRRASIRPGLILLLALLPALPALASGGASARGEERGPAAASEWRLTPRGIGPLRLGMSARRARELAPALRVYRHRYCDTWRLPGLGEVSMFAAHARGGLSAAAIGAFSERAGQGHGAGGVEVGQSVRALKQQFGSRLRFVKRIPDLHESFYRVYANGGRTALEFTINRSHEVEFENAGFAGEFYSTDGVELCD